MDARQWNGSDDRDSLSPNLDKPVKLSKPIPQPKPTPRKALKAKKDRDEAKVKRAVRAACVQRDWWCWVGGSECAGPSEWAHLPPRTRAQTRGMPPEYRHSLEYTAMLCRHHHERVDGKRGPRLVLPVPLCEVT